MQIDDEVTSYSSLAIDLTYHQKDNLRSYWCLSTTFGDSNGESVTAELHIRQGCGETCELHLYKDGTEYIVLPPDEYDEQSEHASGQREDEYKAWCELHIDYATCSAYGFCSPERLVTRLLRKWYAIREIVFLRSTI